MPIRLIAALTIFFFFSTSPLAESRTFEDPPAEDSRFSDFWNFHELVSAERLREHLEIIASDSLLGRGTGQAGIEMAAEYLDNEYRAIGLKPIGDDGTHFQHFELEGKVTRQISYNLFDISEQDTVLSDPVWSQTVSAGNPGDFYNMFGGDVDLEGQVLFAGFGMETSQISHSDSLSVRGNWVMMFADAPDEFDFESQSIDARIRAYLFALGARGMLIINTTDQQEYESTATDMVRLLDTPGNIRLPEGGSRGRFNAAIKVVSPEMATRLLGLSSTESLKEFRRDVAEIHDSFTGMNTDYYLRLSPETEEITFTEKNVMGLLEGCHPELKHETLVISAHYDHMGLDSPDSSGDMIYNGADDNGSGTVTTLVLAETFKKAKEAGHCPDRSILFLHVAAEEHGLLGSRYYSDNPIIPIEDTIVNFNIDMMGRIDDRYIDEEDTDYVYIIGAEIISSKLDSLLHVANHQSVNLNLDMIYNDLDDRNQFYRRSDHWNFGRLGIPFIFFFSGVHADYHQPSDTIEKIPFDLLEKRAQLIYAALIEVANAPKRPEVDNDEFIRRTRSGRR